MAMSTTIVSALFVLVVLLSGREKPDEGRHQNQERDRESCKELLEVGKSSGWVNEGR